MAVEGYLLQKDQSLLYRSKKVEGHIAERDKLLLDLSLYMVILVYMFYLRKVLSDISDVYH